jgi:hypothetical protein
MSEYATFPFSSRVQPVATACRLTCQSARFDILSVALGSENCYVQVSCCSHVSLLCPLFLYSSLSFSLMSPNLKKSSVESSNHICSQRSALTLLSYADVARAVTM